MRLIISFMVCISNDIQWNLSNAVTWGPKIFGFIRQVAALQKTSLKRSCEVLVSDLIKKVLATLNNFDSSKFHEEDN